MTQTHTPSEPSRWAVPALLGVAQLMVVADPRRIDAERTRP